MEAVSRPPRGRARRHTRSSAPEIAMLTAAEEMLQTTELSELNVSELIRRASVSRPTFYFYFASKYAVVAALVEQIFDDIFDAVGPWLQHDPAEDPATTLRTALTAAAELWTRSPPIRAAHQHWQAAPELSDAWLSIMEHFRLALEGQLRQIWSVSAGTPDQRDPVLHSSALTWASERILHIGSVRADPNLATTKQVTDALLALWLPTIYGVVSPNTGPEPGSGPS